MRLISSPTVGLQNATLLTVSIAGLLTFFLPFAISALPHEAGQVSSRTIEASLLLALIVGGSLIIAVAELVRGPGAGNHARSVALLGALVAIDATLRLVPSFLGASPIFALIVLVGYVFGPRFGFVMGTLTLLLSAAITAGVGPWLPFQMLCTGWVGARVGLVAKVEVGSCRVGHRSCVWRRHGFCLRSVDEPLLVAIRRSRRNWRRRTLLVAGAVGGRKHRALRGILCGDVARPRCDTSHGHRLADTGRRWASAASAAAVSCPRGLGHITAGVARAVTIAAR